MHDIVVARATARARGTTGARGTAGTRGTAGDRGTRAAGSPRLWWCCWLCIDCWTRYRRAMSIAAFIVLVAKFPRFVALWRSHVQSSSVIFPHLAFHFGAGRQAQDDCVALLLLHVLGVKGKEQLETGFAAHLLPLLPGGRDAHGGLAGERYRCCCSQCCKGEGTEGRATAAVGVPPGSSGMVVSGVDPTEFALNCATLFCEPMFANNAAIVFSDCAAHRHKESVEDAAVEGAVNRLAAGERGTVGNGVQGRGKRAVEPEAPTVSPAATAAGSTGPRTKGSSSASGAGAGARLVPVNSNTVVALFTYRVTCLLRWVRFYGPRVNSSEHCRCYDPQGFATALPHSLHDLPSLLQRFGVPKLSAATGEEGLARAGLDEGEMHKEYNVGRPNLPRRGAASTSHRSPGVGSTLRDTSNGHFFPTLGHRVEEFLRRFAPKKLARKRRNGPLDRRVLRLLPLVRVAALPPLALPGPLRDLQIPLGEATRASCPCSGPGLAGGRRGRGEAPEAALRGHAAHEQGECHSENSGTCRHRWGRGGGQQQQGEEEWRMWEEVDSWCIAVGRAWPAVEAHDSPLQMGGGKGVGRVGREESEDCCEGMWRAIMEDEALRAAGKDAGKKEKGRAGASYLEPWPGGVNPLACLREMLLGETSYCPQGKVDALAAADAAGAATAEGHGDKGGWRGCASAQCGEVEGAGVQLKLCSRCGKAAYCNRECQRAHWPSHKLTCQPKGKEKVEE
ncbi:unnamed protein product [Closterium sp. NIES-64]|nr:unnamed protein product [Closterium sp. NIES-64]